MEDKIYVHYGTRWWNPQIFRQIVNQPHFTKPAGGLWASPIDAKYGWKDWNEVEHVKECREENSFRFKLRDDANVLYIRSADDLKQHLPKKYEHRSVGQDFLPVYLDFEELLHRGIDAVYVEVSADHRLYWALYGWDCDSILIMNPDIIIQEGMRNA